MLAGMARPLRIEYPGAWYHVMNRVAGRRLALRGAWPEALFTRLLGDIRERFGVECHAWCLMGNHYHVLLHTPEANLGRAMRQLDGVFTQQHNRRSGRDGPLFRGRYRAIIVEADSYLLALSRYIHRNPLEAGLTKRLDAYSASSFPAYVGLARPPGWLETATVLGMIGQRAQRSRYRRYVENPGAGEVEAFYAKPRPGFILGGEAFRKKLLQGRPPKREQPESRRRTRTPGTTEILKSVAGAFDVPVSTLRKARRGQKPRNVPRAVAMYLLQTAGRQKLQEIAATFHVGHYATVSATIARLRADLDTDRRLAAKVQRIADDLA